MATPSIPPHGGHLVHRVAAPQERDRWLAEAQRLPRVVLTPAQQADCELIATGAFSPLEGFLVAEDYHQVITQGRLASGLLWTIPILLDVDASLAANLNVGKEIALHDAHHAVVAILRLASIYPRDKAREAQGVYGTADANHPGVARVLEGGDRLLGGAVTLIARRPQPAPFARYHLDPADARAEFARRGWRRIVGFQTRNPIHRAHEYIQKCAMEICDGLFLHPLVGLTKEDDVPAEVRMRSYEALVSAYYPAERALIGILPTAMRYAGPKEAIFHALVRKNYGCTHFIVGRDHAGVGTFYGTYDAQRIFDDFTPEELGITPLFFDHTFYCRRCGAMASAKTCPHDPEAQVTLSGTKVRELLRQGSAPPPEITRPEVAQILIEAMRQPAAH